MWHRANSRRLVNSNTHIALGRGAQLEHYRVFATGAGATHIDTVDIHQEQDSECKQFTIALGGGLVRATLEAHLNQPGASLDSYSLLVGHAERHVDCVNIVSHSAPNTKSRQTARAIASDHSRVIFNSKVIVDAGAVHSDSQQSFPRPAAVSDRGNRFAAAAGNSYRRGQVRARRHHRPVGSGHVVLFAVARHRPRHGPKPAGVCLPGRCAYRHVGGLGPVCDRERIDRPIT